MAGDPAAPQGEDRAMSGHRTTYYRCGQHIETPCRCPGPHTATIGMTTCPVCSAKPPQAKREFDIASGYHARWMEAEAEAETLRRENAKLRESNTLLNRRATRAEAIVAQRVEEQERKGKSLGRSLANAGYYLLKAENQRFREALLVMAAYHHERECKPGDNTAECLMMRAALDPSSTGTK